MRVLASTGEGATKVYSGSYDGSVGFWSLPRRYRLDKEVSETLFIPPLLNNQSNKRCRRLRARRRRLEERKTFLFLENVLILLHEFLLYCTYARTSLVAKEVDRRPSFARCSKANTSKTRRTTFCTKPIGAGVRIASKTNEGFLEQNMTEEEDVEDAPAAKLLLLLLLLRSLLVFLLPFFFLGGGNNRRNNPSPP